MICVFLAVIVLLLLVIAANSRPPGTPAMRSIFGWALLGTLALGIALVVL
jgi:hypothetical protein